MRCCAVLSNLVSRASGVDFPTIPQAAPDRVETEYRALSVGTYTITADIPEGVTCFIRTNDGNGRDSEIIPASGELTLPYTLTLSSVRKVSLVFGYAGFRPGTWTPIDINDVRHVHAAKSGAPEPDRDVYETVIVRPGEIGEGDTIAKALCAKSSIALTVYPQYEAWEFAKRGETFVRVFDLDESSDRAIFRGRVSKINDRMSANGLQWQVLTCISSADFLEDTSYTDSIALQALGDWLGSVIATHNAGAELARRLTFTLTGAAKVFSQEYIVESNYKALTDVLTSGKYLSKGTGDFSAGYKLEWHERYSNDVTHIDIAEKLGSDCGTAILIGDNLKEINVEYGLDGGIFTSVMAVSGVCSDGCRMEYIAYNAEMFARYGDGRQRVVVNNDIYFKGAGGRDSGGYFHPTPETEAAQAALKAFAEREAAKLSAPSIKITLTAADLAKMGYTGYEPFEVYNTYPVVYPPGGLFGQRMRLTAITRRLSDGQITSMTVECGDKLSDSGGGSLSAQMVRLSAANTAAGDEKKLVEIAETKADTKVEETLDGVNVMRLTKAEYDALATYDDMTLYNVDNNGTNELYIGADHISSGGGGGGTIETAAILSSEQMIYWAPDHELVPVDFRGGAHVYYSQPPAKIVIQKQHAIVSFGGSAPSIGMVSYDDLYEEIVFDFVQNGVTVRQKISIMAGAMQRAMVSGVDTYIINPLIMVGEISGGTETPVGYYQNLPAINIPASADQWSFGLIVSVNELMSANNQPVNPKCTIYAVLKIGTEYTNILGVPSGISGSLFNPPFTAEFLNDAERNFALGVAGIIEPAEELSNGGDGE